MAYLVRRFDVKAEDREVYYVEDLKALRDYLAEVAAKEAPSITKDFLDSYDKGKDSLQRTFRRFGADASRFEGMSVPGKKVMAFRLGKLESGKRLPAIAPTYGGVVAVYDVEEKALYVNEPHKAELPMELAVKYGFGLNGKTFSPNLGHSDNWEGQKLKLVRLF